MLAALEPFAGGEEGAVAFALEEALQHVLVSSVTKNRRGSGVRGASRGLELGDHSAAPETGAGAGGLGLALLAVGSGMKLGQAAQNKALIFIGVSTRLIGMPCIVILMSWLVGLEGLPRTVAIIAGAVPTAASAYVMARKMGGNAELMSNIVTFQIIVAFFTLPLFIYIADTL